MKFPILTAVISVVIVTLYIVFGANPETLVWQRGSHDMWRWVSGHFVHISGTHLIWNLCAFIILGSIIEQHRKHELLIGLIIGAVVINVYLATGYDLPAYAGLSGVLNSLLVIALYRLCDSHIYRNAAILTLVGSMLKIIVEINSGTSLVSHLAWPPVPQAHLLGWLAGITLCIMINTSKRYHFKIAHKV